MQEALRTGISAGMTLIDTAELYGSEELIGRAISGQRDKVFLVSKVWLLHAAMASRARMRGERLSGSGPTISISTSCTGRKRTSHVPRCRGV